MSTIINVHDLKTNYSKYLEQVIRGDEILLGKHGKIVAKIIPLNHKKKPRVPGALKGSIWTSDNFDEPMVELWSTIEHKK